LFIYVNKEAYGRPEVKEFVDFYVAQDTEIAEAAKFVGLNEEQRQALQTAAAGLAA
jgi:phosphate transport system substrate-binding protein